MGGFCSDLPTQPVAGSNLTAHSPLALNFDRQCGRFSLATFDRSIPEPLADVPARLLRRHIDPAVAVIFEDLPNPINFARQRPSADCLFNLFVAARHYSERHWDR
jgi:hypothetical protein